MKKEDLKTGKELELKIEKIQNSINRLTDDDEVRFIDIYMKGSNNLSISNNSSTYTKKANINLTYLNQLYKDNVLRTLEDCKNELEKEFELL